MSLTPSLEFGFSLTVKTFSFIPLPICCKIYKPLL